MKIFQTILILTIIIFSSCSIVGKKSLLYGKCGDDYFACTQFELKEDNTFEFYTFMDVGGGKVIKGNWRYFGIKGDTLVLNSFNQPENPRTYYEGKENEELKGRIKIQISDYELPLGLAYVEINDGERKINLDDEGVGYFEAKEIRNLTCYYLGDTKETIEIENPNLNDITIFVRDLETGVIPEYFVNKLVVANNREVILYPNSAEMKYSLRRSRSGEKDWK